MKIFDNIMSWKKPEMLDLAKELNIKGRSKMNKGEVAESISEILLSDEYFKTVLAALDFLAELLHRDFAERIVGTEAGDQRNGECEGFAGAGATSAENVAAGQ